MFKMPRNEAARIADETAAMRAMTPGQFAAYWLDYDDNGGCRLAYAEEAVAEVKSEHAAESAMFGDSGPGLASWLAESRRNHENVIARLRSFGALRAEA